MHAVSHRRRIDADAAALLLLRRRVRGVAAVGGAAAANWGQLAPGGPVPVIRRVWPAPVGRRPAAACSQQWLDLC